MKTDLWGFKDVKELQRNSEDMPDVILKEQIALLGEKTNFLLYGKPLFIKVQSEKIEYKIATIFNVVVSALDNYEKTIMIMYSNPETDYPISITIDSSYEDDCESFVPRYTCKTKEDFIYAIQTILSSEEVMNIIRILYSKAYMLTT